MQSKNRNDPDLRVKASTGWEGRLAGDQLPCRLLLFLSCALHVVEDPVPDHEESGDDHVGEQSRPEEGPGEDEFIVHRPSPRLVQRRYAVCPGLDNGADPIIFVG